MKYSARYLRLQDKFFYKGIVYIEWCAYASKILWQRHAKGGSRFHNKFYGD